MRGNRAPGRGFEPRLTDPEPGVRDGDAATQKVSGFTPRALLHARQHEIYPKCAEMTMIARKWMGIVCASCEVASDSRRMPRPTGLARIMADPAINLQRYAATRYQFYGGSGVGCPTRTIIVATAARTAASTRPPSRAGRVYPWAHPSGARYWCVCGVAQLAVFIVLKWH